MNRLLSQFARPLAIVVICTALPTAATTACAAVFSFGNNMDGQLGLGPESGDTLVATPIDVSNLGGRKITQVAAGGNTTLLLAEDGSVFQSGHGQYVATPIDLSNLGGRKITQVAEGGNHSLLLADDGSVFSFGYNGSGRTGLGTTIGTTLVPTPIDASNLGWRKVTQVAAGSTHSLLLADDGSVFNFGPNSIGGLGCCGTSLIATPINASNLGGRKITQIAAGVTHSLILAEDGSVFSFGYNSHGQLGVGTVNDGSSFIAKPIDASNLGGRKITQVAAGGQHSLLLAEDGSVFSFGDNFLGRTGLGTISDSNTLVATPIATLKLGGRKITQVAAGVTHSLILAEDGSVFSFGDNYFGQLGVGTAGDFIFYRGSVAQPIVTSNLGGLPVTQVAAGYIHSLLITIPEPGALALAGAAALALVGCVRRSRS
jgi:alpha-tubulin suppressor-like RCC1 family protein